MKVCLQLQGLFRWVEKACLRKKVGGQIQSLLDTLDFCKKCLCIQKGHIFTSLKNDGEDPPHLSQK